MGDVRRVRGLLFRVGDNRSIRYATGHLSQEANLAAVVGKSLFALTGRHRMGGDGGIGSNVKERERA